MIIREPGKVSDRIRMLGKTESCVYLLDGGGRYAILGGGMASIIPDIIAQVRDLGIDEKRIERLVILHSHFDHMGIAHWCKKHWPWIRLTASHRSAKNMADPSVLKTITDFSLMLLDQEGMAERAEEFCLPMVPLAVDDTVKDGDRIECGDQVLEILEVPGHSSCSIAVYLPREKALAASDAGGIPFGDDVFTAANSNFNLYQESLEKMSRLSVEIHLAEHYGAMTGEDGRGYMSRSIESAKKTRALIEETLARTGDEHLTADEITEYFISLASGYFLPRPVLRLVVGQMTRALSR